MIKPLVVIMAGSGSDKEHIGKVVDSLTKYYIPHQVRICSAHKQPETLMGMIREYNQLERSIAYVAIAGGTDALSGTLAFHALGPVVSCPPDAPNQSCLNNPPGSSNAYIARPENVGRFMAQIFYGLSPEYGEILRQEVEEKIKSLEEADKKFRELLKWD